MVINRDRFVNSGSFDLELAVARAIVTIDQSNLRNLDKHQLTKAIFVTIYSEMFEKTRMSLRLQQWHLSINP